MHSALAKLVREHLISLEGVKKHSPVKRASIVYSPDSRTDGIYFVESGYVKISRKGADGKEVLVKIVPPGGIFGEDALTGDTQHSSFAEVMQDGVLYEVSRAVFLDYARSNADAWQIVAEALIAEERELEQKIGMLCLSDVESRILYYLGSLTEVFGIGPTDGQQYSLPLSQSELANLIGATRETTSTTLNGLARRGLLKLGRRLMTVSSGEALRDALRDRQAKSAKA